METDLLNDNSYYENQPHEQFDWLRENSPVHWHEYTANGKQWGLWLLTAYDDIFEVNRDHERFSSSEGVLYPHLDAAPEGAEVERPAGFKPMMLFMDPPEHSDFRKLISKNLTRGAVMEYEPRIRAMARQIVDEVIDRGECEFVTQVAGEMAGRVTAELLGLPHADSPLLYEFTEVYHGTPGLLSEKEIEKRIQRMDSYARRVAAEKLASPGDDLTSKLLQGEVNGDTLPYEAFFPQFILLINGGTDTARNVIALGLHELLRNRDQLAWLMEDLEGRIPLAREELLRWISPVIYQCRTARLDTYVGRQPVKKGQKLAMYFGAANRDPARFPDPHRLDLSRTDNKHVAFGGGHHICIGQWIARVEIDAMLSEVLTRIHNIKVTQVPKWLGSNFIFGLRDLHIRFDRA